MQSLTRAAVATASRNAVCRAQCPSQIVRSFHSLNASTSRTRASWRQPAFPRSSPLMVRWHSSPTSEWPVYDFAKVKEISEAPSGEKIIIDVREPFEYEEGYIPTAINIPVKSQPDALFLPEEEFEDRFGFAKPPTEAEVIFYCKAGVRSSAAAQLARQQGYKNVSEYRGSWLDWEKNGGTSQKP